MYIESIQQNKRNLKMIFSVYCVNFVVLAHQYASIAAAEITNNYPSASALQISMIFTIPAFASIITTILVGYINCSRKLLLIIGGVLWTIGGLACYEVNSLSLLLIFRAVIGLGWGFLAPLSAGLVFDFYGNSPKLNFMVGMQSFSQNLGGVICSVLTALLCAIAWKNIFLIHILGLLMIISFVLLPNKNEYPQFGIKTKDSELETKKSKHHLPGRVWFICICMVFIMMCYFTYMTNIGLLVSQRSLGTTADTGAVMTILTISSMIASILFDRCTKLFKQFTTTVGVLSLLVSLLLCVVACNMFTIYITGVFAGISYGLLLPGTFAELAKRSGAATKLAFSWAAIAIGIGNFATSLVLIQLAALIFGGDGSGFYAFVLGVVVLIFISMIYLTLAIRSHEVQELV